MTIETTDPSGLTEDRVRGPVGIRTLAGASVRRVLSSPCTWIVLAAVAGYTVFATYEYRRLGPAVAEYDLGIFYQTVHSWAFHGNAYSAVKGFSQLGDHFTPAWALLAPLLWVHDSPYTLVLAQVVFLCASAIPVYVAVRRAMSTWIAAGLTCAYLGSMGIQDAIAFPVHEMMFAAPLLAWGIERAMAGRWTQASLLIGALSLVKEDFNVLIVAFAVVALGHRQWRHAAALAVWGVCAYLITVNVLIPHFAPPGGYAYLSRDYQDTLHASSSLQLIQVLVFHPGHTLHLLLGGQVKQQLWLHLLVPVAFLALASPFGWLILPNLVSRLVSGKPTEWSWHYHYDTPLMPILFLAAVDGVCRIAAAARRVSDRLSPGLRAERVVSERRMVLLGGLALTLVSLGTNAYLTGKVLPVGQWIKHPAAFSSSNSWLDEQRRADAMVPGGATVIVTNGLGMPLLTRDTVIMPNSVPVGPTWALLDTRDVAWMPGDYPDWLRGQGFATVGVVGPILVLHRS